MENKKLNIENLDLIQIREDGEIPPLKGMNAFKLSAGQFRFLELLAQGFSLQQVVTYHFHMRVSLSFRSLVELLKFLVEEGYVQDAEFRDCFAETAARVMPSGLVGALMERLFGPKGVATGLRGNVRVLKIKSGADMSQMRKARELQRRLWVIHARLQSRLAHP